MKLKLYEKIIFLILVLIFSYSLFSLINYIKLVFDGQLLLEGMERIEDEDYDPDLDINQTDYRDQMKDVKNFGLSTRGTWSTLNSNTKGIINILNGIVFNQKKLTKKNNPIGVKLTVDTGFICTDPYGNQHKEYTYIDNEGDPDLGLAFEMGNSIGKYGSAMNRFSESLSSSEDKVCKEVELKLLTNSGKRITKTVHVDTKEIEKIDPNNIVNIKSYPEEQEEVINESFKNLNDNINNLLLNDELFYKDSGIFLYFLFLNFLFLYYIFILVINN
tara:strand:+ start:513 stop:1334 length:822 start_codon:yes stop_codon:yes gene_type:complete